MTSPCPILDALAFDSARHAYTLRGSRVPSVTQVIDYFWAEDGARFYTETSRQRGNALHRAVYLLNARIPEVLEVTEARERIALRAPNATELERLWDAVGNYLLFRREYGFTPILSEQLVACPFLRVAGTLDIWGTVRDGRHALVDVKSWAVQGKEPKRASEIQTAGYKLLAKESLGIDTDLRVVLKLTSPPKFYRCEKSYDEGLFQSMCAVWHDLAAHGKVSL